MPIDIFLFPEITEQSERLNQKLNAILPAIKDKFEIDIENYDYKQLSKPIDSGLLPRLRLANINAPIPAVVVGEKKQEFNLDILRDLFEKQQEQIDQVFKQNHDMKISLKKHQDQIDVIKQNQIPIGFIYVQLSGQSDPNTLWPNTEWNNISKNYSGLFFRAEGGNSASFGQIQNEQARSLKVIPMSCGVKTALEKKCWPWGHDYSLTVSSKLQEKGVFTGGFRTDGDHQGLKFLYR